MLAAGRRCPGFERGFTLNEFVNDSCSATGRRSIDLDGRTVLQGLVRSLCVVEPEVIDQAQL